MSRCIQNVEVFLLDSFDGISLDCIGRISAERACDEPRIKIGQLIEVSSAGESNQAANVGAGAGLFRDKIGATLNFKSLVAGVGTSIVEGPDTISIDAGTTDGANANTGGGIGVFIDKLLGVLRFKGIVAGAGVAVSDDVPNNEILITNRRTSETVVLGALAAGAPFVVTGSTVSQIEEYEFSDQLGDRIELRSRRLSPTQIEVISNVALTNVQAHLIGI